MTNELVVDAPAAPSLVAPADGSQIAGSHISSYIAEPHRPALPPRSLAVGYVLLVVLGVLGIHQFYLGKIGRGVLYLLTGGVLGLGLILDLFTLPSQTRTINARRAVGIK